MELVEEVQWITTAQRHHPLYPDEREGIQYALACRFRVDAHCLCGVITPLYRLLKVRDRYEVQYPIVQLAKEFDPIREPRHDEAAAQCIAFNVIEVFVERDRLHLRF